jgi:hypothetical protein
MSTSVEQRRYPLRNHSAVIPQVQKEFRNPEHFINGSRKKKTSAATTTTAQVVAALMSKTVNSTATMPITQTTTGGDCKPTKADSDGESSVEVANAKKLIVEYSLDPYDYSHDELIHLSVEMLKHYHLLEIFHFSESAAKNFFYAVKDLYRTNNDFHNFRHAWGVMHMCFQILLHGGEQHLDAFDILAVLVAAICHDVGHPGNNNAFELAINSDVSKKYAQPNEICVLEKYHASETQSLLSKKDTRKNSNILVTLTEEEKQRFFNQVKFIILGTDMAKHSQLVEEAKELINQIIEEHSRVFKSHSENDKHQCVDSENRMKLSSCSSSSLAIDSLSGTSTTSVLNSPASSDLSVHSDGMGKLKTNKASGKNKPVPEKSRVELERMFHDPKTLLSPDIRLSLTRIIVHTADIGAQTQQLRIATKWAERVYNEFRSQAEKEKALGIVTSPFIHQLSEDYMIYTSQASFIQDIVLPIWNALFQLLPNLQFAVEQLDANKRFYHEHGEGLKAKSLVENKREKEQSQPQQSSTKEMEAKETMILEENCPKTEKNIKRERAMSNTNTKIKTSTAKVEVEKQKTPDLDKIATTQRAKRPKHQK